MLSVTSDASQLGPAQQACVKSQASLPCWCYGNRCTIHRPRNKYTWFSII